MKSKHQKVTHASQLAESSSWRSYQRKLLELKLEGLPQEAYTKESAKNSFLAFCDLVSDAGGFALENAPLDAKAYEVIGSAFEDIAEGRYPILLVSMPPRSGKTTLGVHLLEGFFLKFIWNRTMFRRLLLGVLCAVSPTGDSEGPEFG